MELTDRDLHYLRLLAQQYPSIQAASTEIINLSAILNLPKGTEHFISDVHGEYEAFVHVLRNASGSIRSKIDDVFANTLLEREKRELATLIYYPERKMALILSQLSDHAEWYRITIFRLIRLCRVVASKYTRSKVRKALPHDFAYILEELLHEQESVTNKQEYYQGIVDTIIALDRASACIVALAYLIQRLGIDHMHITGDVYDRGPGAHIIMDALLEYHSVDIQWGNHDIVWMGAAAGSQACTANVIRVSLRYASMATLENGYAISVLPLASFALDVYGDDPCTQFLPKGADERTYTDHERLLMARMHKAITIIQLKLEGQIIKRRPHYLMEDRLLIDKIDRQRGVIRLGAVEYPLVDANFPTIDPADPYALTAQEQAVLDQLQHSFVHSEKLQRHVRFLYAHGSMYLVHNGNLLYHGCIPMNEDGSYYALQVGAESFVAKEFMDRVDRLARQGYFTTDDPAQKEYGLDVMWYLWSGAHSPLFGKDKMATFERYFIADKATHTERKNPYYTFLSDVEMAEQILTTFGLDPATAHIVNGHVPVKANKGESPIKAGGKLIVIDGGFSKAYQQQTGIAGYTLIYNSYGLLLVSHYPFVSTEKAIEEEIDIHSDRRLIERVSRRLRVRDTDLGQNIQRQIDELQQLLAAYREGYIKERR